MVIMRLTVLQVYITSSNLFFFLAHYIPLFDKLRKLDLDPFVLLWLGNYLGNILQQVVVGGQISESAKVVWCSPYQFGGYYS